MQHNLREFLRHGGSGQYVFARQNGAVYGYRAGISIKSVFPGYAELRADFTDQLDRVIADNARMLLNALTPPDTVPWVTEADLRDVSDAKEEALRQWDARLTAIFEEYETHPQTSFGSRTSASSDTSGDLKTTRKCATAMLNTTIRCSAGPIRPLAAIRDRRTTVAAMQSQLRRDCRIMLFLQNLRYRQTVFQIAAGLYAGWQMAFWPGHRRGWRPMLRWKPTTCFKASYSPLENSELETPLRSWVLTLAPWRGCWPRNPTLRRWFWQRMASCQGLRNVANGRE